MNPLPESTPPDELVPDHVIPHKHLPPLRYRDLPEPVPLRKMLGPSIILAGLALGSGEFIIWPYITYKSQFVFFWACLLGVTTQYFINMEIVRWTLATGESAITGFIRTSRWLAGIFLVMNIVPWMIPAWAKGAAQIVSWLIWGPNFDDQHHLVSQYETPMAIAGMIGCGLILTAGPVIYETIEKIQVILVSLVLVLVVGLTIWLVGGRPDAVWAQFTSAVTLGAPQFVPTLDADLDAALLLGALAFAGAGGTTNLGQSNYIKDKGYGMGRWIGRITSPITGNEEAITEVGYHFPHTPENLRRWQQWWRAASIEHFSSFFCTCLVCLTMLTLISYTIYYDAQGKPVAGSEKLADDISFVWGEASEVAERIGQPAKVLFLIMGIAILLTTEFGVLDVSSRISTDIVKVAWLRENKNWSESRLYYLFLWGTILIGTGILLAGEKNVGSFLLFKLASSLNGAVMFLYSGLLLYLNWVVLPAPIRIGYVRSAVLLWSVAFFGFFTVWAAYTIFLGQ